MAWVIGTLIILVAGVALRRLLRINGRPARPLAGLTPLGPDREAVYSPIAREIEIQSAILGISLNDAFEERASDHEEIAWHLVRLSASEWDRLEEIVNGLLSGIQGHWGEIRSMIPVRAISSRSFKSRVMIDFVRTQELLDQLVIRPKMRFQLRIRVLRRATEILTSDFRRAFRYAERLEDRPPELWERLDVLCHDFDLVTKEILLAFRAFLYCLPQPALEPLAKELERVTYRPTRPVSFQTKLQP